MTVQILDDKEMDHLLEINITKAVDCEFHGFGDTVILKLDIPENELFNYFDDGYEWEATENMIGRHWFLHLKLKKNKNEWNKYIIYLCMNELSMHEIAKAIANTTRGKQNKYGEKSAEVIICGKETKINKTPIGEEVEIKTEGKLLKIHFPSGLGMHIIMDEFSVPFLQVKHELRDVCPTCKYLRNHLGEKQK